MDVMSILDIFGASVDFLIGKYYRVSSGWIIGVPMFLWPHYELALVEEAGIQDY